MSKQKRDLPEINFIAASLRTTTGEAHHDLIDVAIVSKNNFREKGLISNRRKFGNLKEKESKVGNTYKYRRNQFNKLVSFQM